MFLQEVHEMNENLIIISLRIEGAMSRGFRRFLVQTILKLVAGNLTHVQHFL